MTSAPPSGKDSPARHPFGPRPIGALLPALTRPAFRRNSPAGVQVMMDWPEIVGPALAASTRARRCVAGTLTIGCSGPVALELQHLAGPLMERVNRHVGKPLVTRLRFVQESFGAPGHAPPAKRLPIAPLRVDGVPDGPLKDALGALGASIVRDQT